MVKNLLEHHWKRVWGIYILQTILHFAYLAMLWWRQDILIVLLLLGHTTFVEVLMISVQKWDYFLIS